MTTQKMTKEEYVNRQLGYVTRIHTPVEYKMLVEQIEKRYEQYVKDVE